MNRSSRPMKSPYVEDLPGERRVTTVVVHRRVVEPRGLLGLLVARVEERRVGEGAGVQLGPLRRRLGDVVAVVERLPGGVLVREGLLRAVGVLLLLVVDDVGGVVGDDVEEDLHPLGVGRRDEGLHVGVGAEVRVDLGEVGDPVAVVAGALLAGPSLDGLVLEARRQPDGRGAHVLDVVQLLGDALEVATVVEALVGRVEPGGQRPPGETAEVVGLRPVREAVGHDEVEALAGQRRPQRVLGQPRSAGVVSSATTGEKVTWWVVSS